MHIGYDVQLASTPFTTQVFLCPCPLNGTGGDSKFTTIMRYQGNVAGAIHLCNVRDSSFVKYVIHIPLLPDIHVVNLPEIFILDVIGDVSICGTAD